MISATILGAGRCVTGSKYLLGWKRFSLLVDCGLFQGPAQHRRLNWQPLPTRASAIDRVILTHAHIDHTGYLPRLCRQGFSGPVHCTPPTAALLRVLLPDAARLQEEEARYANRAGYSKHRPALPLFRVADARRALKMLHPVDFETWTELHPGIRFRFLRQGHILGAAAVEIDTKASGGGRKSLFFSGDVGRFGIPILREPTAYPGSDVLFVESTYGDRTHDPREPREVLEQELRQALDRGGVVLIPAFAVDRTQEVLYLINELMMDGDLPQVPIWLDSPMAIETTSLYTRFISEHDVEMRQYFSEQQNPIFPPTLTATPSTSDSKRLNRVSGPGIIISASGMATGGRILHHLKLRLPNPENTVLFVGYQAEGTKGRRLVEGEERVKIHGEWVPVRARVAQVTTLSAHADAEEMVLWLGRRQRDPEQVVVTHGEYQAQRAFAERLEKEFGWTTVIPELGDCLSL